MALGATFMPEPGSPRGWLAGNLLVSPALLHMPPRKLVWLSTHRAEREAVLVTLLILPRTKMTTPSRLLE